MRTYFTLQSRWIARHLRDFGLAPWLGYALGAILFAGLSAYAFHRFGQIEWLYAGLGVIPAARLSESGRNLFLRNTYPLSSYRQIRVVENTLVSAPFILTLGMAREAAAALSLALATMLLSQVRIDRIVPYTIPTPFSRRPFEFATGFRKSWVWILIAHVLEAIAICHDNFNLGAFAIGALIMIAMTYYSTPEPGIFVWMHAGNARSFLREKVRTGILYLGMLCLPAFTAATIIWPGNLPVILAIWILGGLYMITLLFGKYAIYPSEWSLPLGIVIALGVSFPPLLAGIMPWLYKRALRNLFPLLP